MSRLAKIVEAASSIDRLSSATGLSVERLREIANNAEPTMAEIRRLSVSLGMTVSELLAPEGDFAARASLLFRTAPVSGAEVSTESLERLSSRLANSFSVLNSRETEFFADWQRYFLPPEDTLLNAEANAAIFRREFYDDDQLSPLIRLPEIVSERVGILIFPLNTSDFDGASAYMDGVPFIFVSRRFPGRMLFTVAHEVGHLVAHHRTDASFAVVDEAAEANRSPNAPDQAREHYADAFASALLMPSQSVGISIKKVRELAGVTDAQVGDLEINYLARIYGVSFWAAARRCEDLELIPRGGAWALNQKISNDFKSAEKRAEAAGLPPRQNIHFAPVPKLLLTSAIQKIRAGELSVGGAAERLGVTTSDFFALHSDQVG